MRGAMKRKLRSRALPALLVLAGAAMLLVAGSGPERESLTSASVLARRQASGGPQLVSVQPMPGLDGQMCEWVPASANMTLAAALQEHATAAANPAGSNAIDRKPLRAIRDTYATYSAIALNMQDNEVY